jgi:hypothetical protein
MAMLIEFMKFSREKVEEEEEGQILLLHGKDYTLKANQDGLTVELYAKD